MIQHVQTQTLWYVCRLHFFFSFIAKYSRDAGQIFATTFSYSEKQGAKKRVMVSVRNSSTAVHRNSWLAVLLTHTLAKAPKIQAMPWRALQGPNHHISKVFPDKNQTLTFSIFLLILNEYCFNFLLFFHELQFDSCGRVVEMPVFKLKWSAP